MDARLQDVSDEELAEWQYVHRNELESGADEEVEVEISPHLSVTISFRLPGAEADEIRQAARDAGLSLSEWIRRACTDALHPDEATRHQRALQAELHGLARELEAVAQRFDAASDTPSA